MIFDVVPIISVQAIIQVLQVRNKQNHSNSFSFMDSGISIEPWFYWVFLSEIFIFLSKNYSAKHTLQYGSSKKVLSRLFVWMSKKVYKREINNLNKSKLISQQSMVFIQYKVSEKNNFTIECPGNTLVSEVLLKLIEINNLRIYLDRLIWSVEEMTTKGVLRPQELQGISYEQFEKNRKEFDGLDEQKLQYATKPVVEAPYKFVPDKYFQRHGVILPEDQNSILKSAVQKAKKVLEAKKEVTLVEQILSGIQQIRNAIMQVFPAYIGLPEWEPVLLILEEKLELEVLVSEKFQLFDAKGTVWWAGKQLDSTKPISEYAGKNEKTRIIVKVQRFGGELPPREPPIDAQTYSKMVKFYYKKVEQNKQFEKKSVQSHYQKIQTESMKEKLYLQDSLRFKPF